METKVRNSNYRRYHRLPTFSNFQKFIGAETLMEESKAMKTFLALSLAGPLFLSAEMMTKKSTLETLRNVPSITLTIRDSNSFVARVIFAETVGTDSMERLLVASVIKNRINQQGFSRTRLNTMEEVVKETVGKNKVKAFSCIDDSKNRQWKKTENLPNLSKKETKVWNESLVLSTGNFKPINETIVAYHDKSISIPSGWKNNPYWEYSKKIETKNFVFYSISKRGE
jgi:hypothetical protein